MPTALLENWKATGFRGNLAEVRLPSVLAILEMERKTGTLIVDHGRETARLQLRKGRVIRAHKDDAAEPRHAELVYQLIATPRGSFDFHPSKVAIGDDIQCPTSRLIVEGIRRMDQASTPPLPFYKRISARVAAAVLWVAVMSMFLVRSVMGTGQRNDVIGGDEAPESVQPAHDPGN